MLLRPFLVGCAVTLAACSTPQVDVPTISASPSTKTPAAAAVERPALRTLTVDDALELITDPRFASAEALAALRPKPLKEIRTLRLEVLSGDSKTPLRSSMHFSPLPGGLEHVRHSSQLTGKQLGPNEAFVETYGMGAVLYWNFHFANAGFEQTSIPTQMRLLEGKPFTLTSSFSVEKRRPDGGTTLTRCRFEEKVGAATLHPNLTGAASIFLCEENPGQVKMRVWYLEDAARYVNSEIVSDGWVQARFRISEVVYQ